MTSHQVTTFPATADDEETTSSPDPPDPPDHPAAAVERRARRVPTSLQVVGVVDPSPRQRTTHPPTADLHARASPAASDDDDDDEFESGGDGGGLVDEVDEGSEDETACSRSTSPALSLDLPDCVDVPSRVDEGSRLLNSARYRRLVHPLDRGMLLSFAVSVVYLAAALTAVCPTAVLVVVVVPLAVAVRRVVAWCCGVARSLCAAWWPGAAAAARQSRRTTTSASACSTPRRSADTRSSATSKRSVAVDGRERPPRRNWCVERPVKRPHEEFWVTHKDAVTQCLVTFDGHISVDRMRQLVEERLLIDGNQLLSAVRNRRLQNSGTFISLPHVCLSSLPSPPHLLWTSSSYGRSSVERSRQQYIVSTASKKGKGSQYSITERRVPELILVLGSQPTGDVSHKPGRRLPLLSARPAVTPATLKTAATYFAAR